MMDAPHDAGTGPDFDFEAQIRSYFPLGLHLNRETWNRYGLTELVGRDHGGTVQDEVRVIRHIAKAMNETDAPEAQGLPAVGAGHLLTLGLLNDILRYVAAYYLWDQIPGVFDRCLHWSAEHKSPETVRTTLQAFVQWFPPEPVATERSDEQAFLERTHQDDVIRTQAYVEMILLRLAVMNPALRPFLRLFRDDTLRQQSSYVELVHVFESFFATQPVVDEIGETLFECLRAPMRHAPDSLEDQLEYIRRHWTKLLPASLLRRVLMVQGIVKEEFAQRGMGDGPNLSVMDFRQRFDMGAVDYPEPERYSPDADWMGNVILLAKTVYVWLDQLSKKYQRPIHRLDQVPDDELDTMARRGFNSLWLIGLWERSTASEDIKRWTGNPEAISSAYSLYDYEVAADLGGYEAYRSLNDRARQRGIRLASDMVPNHMGIYSRWVIQHPDWFLQLDHPPYPSYTFNGGNLSRDESVGIHIEDGYWERRDAAVVFKRVDHRTGHTRYIYHGNDGTSMPWNDTAQLNYLLPEVREAVIQTILHVARMFSVIRFDAAMTLAKKHYQRLWFPKPGDAGAIPSRAEHGMSKEEFDRAFPEEFWREVVDRVAQEAPDTLLLAEAFWLMEGYFVRTLGMHRVYNSAFMNMLKMEENSKYRMTVKNVLEYSPGILRRFVNFMNNPDEMTAADQFGKGDKYFGVCALMITLPGLPMFGHGQVEGYREKYGMEYRRAYWDEAVDEGLVQRHEREIFPLLHRRYMFSGVEAFAFYDFHTNHGYVDENVFAYSNRHGNDRSIFIYNNAYNTTEGWIKRSTPINRGSADTPALEGTSLGEALGIRGEDHVFYVYRDYREGLEYVRSGRAIHDEGLFTRLYGYQYYALLDFREYEDKDGNWRRLCDRLQGRGVPSMDREYREMVLAPVMEAFCAVFNADVLNGLGDPKRDAEERNDLRESAEVDMQAFTKLFSETVGFSLEQQGEGPDTREYLDAAMELPANLKALDAPKDLISSLTKRAPGAADQPGADMRIVTVWALLQPVDFLLKTAGQPHWLHEWLLGDRVVNAFHAMGREWWEAHEDQALVQVLMNIPLPDKVSTDNDATRLRAIIDHDLTRQFLGYNHHQGHDYIVKEQLETLLRWRMVIVAVRAFADNRIDETTTLALLSDELAWSTRVSDAARSGGYDMAETYAYLSGKEKPVAAKAAAKKAAASRTPKKH